jgi:AraC family transcriptional regulator
VSLLVRGDLEERVGRRVETAGPLSVVVKPAGVEHADRFGRRGAVAVQVVLSPADEGWADGAMDAWRWSHAPEAARPLLRLLGALHEPSGPEPLLNTSPLPPMEDLLCEVLAGLAAGPSRGPSPPWLARACRALDEESASIREVARAIGIHPVHLAREFRRRFGVTPTAYRRRGRVRRAARLLAHSTLPLAETALAAGYADQAHMTRELRAVAGLTPRGLRRLVAAA